MSEILAQALALSQSHGFSVVPVAGHDWTFSWIDEETKERRERSLRKAPAYLNGQGPRPFKWKHLEDRIMAESAVRQYFAKAPNLGVVFGPVSGHAECVDFDEPGLYEEWRALLEENGHADLAARLVVQSTQTPGHYQAMYRCPEGVEGNQKLALRPATEDEISERPTQKAVGLIETRGKGGYALVEPSMGYRVAQGSLDALPTVTAEERRVLLDAARHFDAMPPEELANRSPRAPNQALAGLSPGDDFDRRADWSDVLEPHGWRAHRTRGRLIAWTRPGKDGHAVSAHTGLGHHGVDFLVVFSTNGWPLQPTPMKYGKFRAYCVLNEGGDASEHQSRAAKALYARGYGERVKPKTSEQRIHDHSPAGAPDQEGATDERHSPDDERPGFWAARTMDIDGVLSMADKPMLVEGLIGKQDRCMWVGSPGCGKTFGLIHLLVCCAMGGEFAFQFDVVRPLRVAYCSSEGRFGMKRRILAALEQFGATLDDVRPYMRFVSDVPQFHKSEGERGVWAFVESLEMAGFVPDILAIDTLSKATLGSKEVDNGEAALICDVATRVGERLDCSTIFAHHTGWDNDRPRGASAYFGDMDVIVLQKLNGETRTGEIQYFKGKEIEPFAPIPFRLVGVAEHKTAIMDFSAAEPLEREMTAIQRIVLTMVGNPDRAGWTVAALVAAIKKSTKPGEVAPTRESVYSALKQHSQTKLGTEQLFVWDSSKSPHEYRRIG